jgi:RecA-family ATPase
MRTDEVRNLTSPEWLVQGIIPQNVTVQLFGREGSHKSFIALDLAFCVAIGKAFHGHPTLKGRVLYIAAEGGAPIADRIRAWEEHNVVTCDDVDFFMEEELMLDNHETVKEAIAEWQDNNYKLIIFDTLRTSSEGDEVSAKTMNAITRGMRMLQRAFDATVIVVNHSTKTDAKTYAGGGAMGTNIATNIRVIYDEKEVTTFECTKQKDADKFETIAFRHKPVGKSLVMVSDEEEKVVVHSSPHDETILTLLSKYVDGIARAEFKKECVNNGVPPATTYRRFTALEAQGRIKQDEIGRLYRT